jgi:outer membrane protein assembly factor BamB
MLKQKSICLVFYLIFLSNCPLIAQSNFEVLWNKPLEGKIEHIWNMNDYKHLILKGNNKLYLVTTLDGSIIWQKGYENFLTFFPIKDKNVIVILAPVSYSTGVGGYEILIVYPISGEEITIKAVIINVNNIQYVTSLEAFLILQGSSIFLIDVNNGTVIWRSRFKNAVENLINYKYDPVNKNLLILAHKGQTGVMVSLNSSDGKINWENQSTNRSFELEGARFSNWIIHDNHIYLELGGLSRINYETGAYVWHTDYSTVESRGTGFKYSVLMNSNALPIIKNDEYVITASKGSIRRIDLKTGYEQWKSPNYNLTPATFIRGDTVFVITGGIFEQLILQKVTLGQFLTMVAIGTFTGLTTGWMIAPLIASRPSETTGIGDFESISVKELKDRIVWEGNPGIVAHDLKLGLPIYRFEGKGQLSGIYVDYPQTILGDQENIYRINLRNGKADIVFPIRKLKIGECTRYLLKTEDNKYIIITSNFGGEQKGHYIGKISLDSKEPIWLTLISKEGKNEFPLVLTQDVNDLYILLNSVLISINKVTGKIQWQQELPDIGWSLSLENNTLVYFKGGVLYYCRFKDLN